MSVPSLDHLLRSFDAALTEEISVLHATAVTSSSFPDSSSPPTFHHHPTSHNLAIMPEEEPPEPVEDVTPLVSSVDLLRRLQERLRLIGRNPGDWSTALALKALSPSSHPNALTTPKTLPLEASLDESQMEAYRRALTDDLLFLWGPPGTGKTRVISQILQTTLKHGLRVLLCSTTNAAVDHALEEVLEDLKEERTDNILRIGTPSANASPQIHTVTLTQGLDEHAAPLREEFKQLQAVLPALKTEVRILREESNQLRRREQQARQITTLTRDRNRIAHSLTDLQSQTQELITHRDLLQKKLQTTPSWKNWLCPRRRANLQKAIDTNNQAIHSLHITAGAFLQTFNQRDDQLAKIQMQKDDRVSERRCDLQERSAFELHEALRQAEAQLADTHARLDALRVKFQSLEHDLVRHAQVIATTLTRASCFQLLESERFDMVIVDEASLASLPTLFATLCYAQRHVVLVGDFLQLPPIAHNTSSTSSPWLTQSIYDVAQIQHHHDPRVAALPTQYRMHPDIGDLAGTLYRQRGLPFRSAPFLSDDRQVVVSLPPFPHSALAVVDTTHACPQTHRDEQGSPLNFYHTLVVLRLITQTFLNLHTASPPLTIAVMSPYRAQTTVIQRCVELQQWEQHVHVGTIHQCQGQQFDVAIFDTTIINNLRRSFLCQPQSSSGGTTLLNVAMTRAKSKLILVGHARALASLPPETFLRTCFDYTCMHGVTIDSVHVMSALSHPVPDRWWQDDQILATLLEPLQTPCRPLLTTV